MVGRLGSPLCVAFGDVGDLKTVNDTCGHVAGDALSGVAGDFGVRLPVHDVPDLLRQADANLYVIKQAGRDGLFVGTISDDGAGAPARSAAPSTERKVRYE